jgi:hypothetical protein
MIPMTAGRDNNVILSNEDSLKKSKLTESMITSEETQKYAATIKLILLQISISNGTKSKLLSPSAAAPSKELLVHKYYMHELYT